MRIERVKNFLSQEDCNYLNNWTRYAVQAGLLGRGITTNGISYDKRLTSRMCSDVYVYPKIVRDISSKIRHYCNISKYPLITGHGRDGVVVSYTLEGGDVYPHKDPKSSEGLATLRCNILTQKSGTGARLFIEDTEVDVQVGELHCYLVSEHTHYVTENTSEVPRIMWMFGAHVPPEDWNSSKIKLL